MMVFVEMEVRDVFVMICLRRGRRISMWGVRVERSWVMFIDFRRAEMPVFRVWSSIAPTDFLSLSSLSISILSSEMRSARYGVMISLTSSNMSISVLMEA